MLKPIKVVILILTSTWSLLAFSSHANCTTKVTMDFYTEKWLQTSNSEVTIAINASAPANKADAISKEFITKLSKISNQADWQITSINSSESESGLLKISAQANARIENNKLGELRTNLKSLSTPGEQYNISSISNQAELTTINNNKAALRKDLYAQIMKGENELNTANIDGKSSYKVYKIFFKDRNNPKVMGFVTTSAKNMRSNNDTSEKMYMSAQATYAICDKFE